MKKSKFIARAILVGLCGIAIGLQVGCATRGGTVALNIGTSRSAAIAGENTDTPGVEVEGSGGIDAQIPLK